MENPFTELAKIREETLSLEQESIKQQFTVAKQAIETARVAADARLAEDESTFGHMYEAVNAQIAAGVITQEDAKQYALFHILVGSSPAFSQLTAFDTPNGDFAKIVKDTLNLDL